MSPAIQRVLVLEWVNPFSLPLEERFELGDEWFKEFKKQELINLIRMFESHFIQAKPDRLQYMTHNSYLRLCQEFLAKGLAIDHVFEPNEDQLIHFAVAYKNIEATYFLVFNGCCVLRQNVYFDIPFNIALRQLDYDLQEYLFDLTFDPQEADEVIRERTRSIVWCTLKKCPFFDEILSRIKTVTWFRRDCHLLENSWYIPNPDLNKLITAYPNFICYTFNYVFNNREFWEGVLADQWGDYRKIILPFWDTQPEYLKNKFRVLPFLHAVCEGRYYQYQPQEGIYFFLSYGCEVYLDSFEKCEKCTCRPNAFRNFMARLKKCGVDSRPAFIESDGDDQSDDDESYENEDVDEGDEARRRDDRSEAGETSREGEAKAEEGNQAEQEDKIEGEPLVVEESDHSD